MVVNDHDTVDASCPPVLCDVRKIAGISLPDLSEFIFLVCFTIAEVGISGSFEIIVSYKALDAVNADRSRDKRFPDQMIMDLRGIHARVFFLDSVDLGDGILI